MAIKSGTCVGVLYFKDDGKGNWTVGVHNGVTRNTVTNLTDLLLGHVKNESQMKNPETLIFYRTLQEYHAALKKPPSTGTPFGVRIATKETAKASKHACVAFIQSIFSKKGAAVSIQKQAHNGKFIQYTSPRGIVHKNVASAITSIKNDPGGTLLYYHYNLVPKGSGRYDLVQEAAIKTGITELTFLK